MYYNSVKRYKKFYPLQTDKFSYNIIANQIKRFEIVQDYTMQGGSFVTLFYELKSGEIYQEKTVPNNLFTDDGRKYVFSYSKLVDEAVQKNFNFELTKRYAMNYEIKN